ncbi:TAF6-like RNA polymerase II p300/CBP-associated factor-associated factor 65 kDa subunit 6L [Littorina saxatilis]|uniref:Histone H4 n=1 Tax=Littorina saxatilis TaxID=31220 RepID=A0AAN9GCR3_9CAEN
MIEEKAFAIITKDSVQLMAEGAGHNCVSDDVAVLLGEDVSYRLREAVMKSAAFMKNAKRRRLCPEDFNQALQNSDVPPILGHGTSVDSTIFRQTREGELHFVEDPEVNLSNAVGNSYVPKSLGKVSVKGQWMAVEGVNKFLTHGNSHSQNAYRNAKREVPAELMEYYSQITKALLGSHTVLVKWALADLSTNVGVTQLLPYFVNFVANGVKAAGHDVLKLTLLLRTVEALVKNPHLFLETQPYLSLLVQSLESCLLEPLAGYANQQSVDHWMMRQFAAYLLADIVRKCNNETNHLHSSVTKRLSESLQDLTRPFCSHYGAVMALMAFGATEVKTVVVPQLEALLPHVSSFMESLQPARQHLYFDALKVYGALQLAIEKMLKTQMEEFLAVHEENDECRSTDGNPPTALDSACDMVKLYQKLSDSFGGTLSVQLPVMELSNVFGRHPPQDHVILGDPDSRRSGDDLLSDLMQQVRKQERERQERQKRQQWSEVQNPVGHQGMDGGELFHSARPKYGQWDESDNMNAESGYQEQMAVSSTISDPMKGTLKLKIKRHAQGQGSPSMHAGKSEVQRQNREVYEKDMRHKKKRKQSSKNPWDYGAFDSGELSDPEDLQFHSHQLLGHPSSVGESSGSDSLSFQRKGKLMLKLKVPTKESPSD